jgi:RNA polymerase sigma-70 factor (ECF subfamily)
MQLQALDASSVLGQAMAGLTPNERRVLDLCYGEGMTHAEIASCLDRPLGTVKTWIRKAIRSMREHMQPPSE